MKATKLLLASAIFAGLTALSFAGPGPDHWARLTKAAQDRAKAKAEAQAQPAADTTKVAQSCATSTTCACCAKKV